MERIIENFKDDSMHKVWGSESSVSKVDVYKWNAPTQKGEFMYIDKKELKIDLSYQRDADSKKRISEISKNFDWALFGVILVALNDHGYYVIDGGHRIRGAMRREDITEVPCMVFVFDKISDEARVFFNFNNQRKTVSTFDNHKAALRGDGDFLESEIAIKAENLAGKYGYKFASSPKPMFELKSIAAVYSMIRQDEILADKCFSVLAKVAEGSEIQSKELSGLFYLMQTNRAVDFESFPMRNMIEAGILKIRESIKRLSVFEGVGGAKVAAKAMLEIINKGQSKTKVFVP